MASDARFDRIDQAFLTGQLAEQALAMQAEGVPVARIALSLYIFFVRELRLRGRQADIPRLLDTAPAVLAALGCPVGRLERALRERSLGRMVLELHDGEKWPKSRILSALKCFSVLLTAQGRDDEDVLDVMDRLTGFGARELQLWPDELDD